MDTIETKKVVIKKYVDEEGWRETTLEDAIEHLEGSGYWKPGTVQGLLEDGATVWNPFAHYQMIDVVI